MPIALVTGANRGLGLELVRQLVERDYRVFAGSRSPEEATDLRALAERQPMHVSVLRLDVTDAESVQAAVATIQRETHALDLLVNNAGISGGGRQDAFGALDRRRMLDVLHVNAVAPVLLVQEALAVLKAGQHPKVVNLTSQLGSIGRVAGPGTWYSYRASKAALNMITRLLAFELAPEGLAVAVLHPGWVRTDMGGNKAPLAPEEAVRGMLHVIEQLQPEDGGTFLTWDGDTLPW